MIGLGNGNMEHLGVKNLWFRSSRRWGFFVVHGQCPLVWVKSWRVGVTWVCSETVHPAALLSSMRTFWGERWGIWVSWALSGISFLPLLTSDIQEVSELFWVRSYSARFTLWDQQRGRDREIESETERQKKERWKGRGRETKREEKEGQRRGEEDREEKETKI